MAENSALNFDPSIEMEDEKKKRKNKKKKKNKQQAKAATEDTASNAGDTSSSEQSHVLESKDHLSRSVDSNVGVTDNGSIKIVEDKVDRDAQIMSSVSYFQLIKRVFIIVVTVFNALNLIIPYVFGADGMRLQVV